MPTTYYALLIDDMHEIEGEATRYDDNVYAFTDLQGNTTHFFGKVPRLQLLGEKRLADAQHAEDQSCDAIGRTRKVMIENDDGACVIKDNRVLHSVPPMPFIHYRIAVLSGRVDTQLCPNTGEYGTTIENAVTCPACLYLLDQTDRRMALPLELPDWDDDTEQA